MNALPHSGAIEGFDKIVVVQSGLNAVVIATEFHASGADGKIEADDNVHAEHRMLVNGPRIRGQHAERGRVKQHVVTEVRPRGGVA